MEDIITKWDMLDFNPCKEKFTWSIRRVGVGQVVVRLDQFLIHNSWIIQEKDP